MNLLTITWKTSEILETKYNNIAQNKYNNIASKTVEVELLPFAFAKLKVDGVYHVHTVLI